jgi:ribosomal protein S18 acetylase RimI-like enzyme
VTKAPIPLVAATRKDAAEILNLQKLAYRSEAEIYNDFSIPPLVQTLTEMEHDIDSQVVLKAESSTGIIGSVRAFQKGDTVYIGRVIVNPEHQGRGLGKKLMQAIEASFPEAKRFELFTGQRSERNLHLYRKLGYKDFRTENVTPTLTFVYLEKMAEEGKAIPTPAGSR